MEKKKENLKLFLENDYKFDAVKIFGNKNDHHILNAALSLKNKRMLRSY